MAYDILVYKNPGDIFIRIPQTLFQQSSAHRGLAKIQLMPERSDAFLAVITPENLQIPLGHFVNHHEFAHIQRLKGAQIRRNIFLRLLKICHNSPAYPDKRGLPFQAQSGKFLYLLHIENTLFRTF